MNRRQAKKKRTRETVWYIMIEYDSNGNIFDPYPCEGIIKGKNFVDIQTGEKYKLSKISRYIFSDIVDAAKWVDVNFGRTACCHMLKALFLID